MSHDVLIVGASTRAAAFTALRCGLRPRCIDYFADRDLAAVCTVERIEPAKSPQAFLDAAENLPPSPWFYTGGLENHPDLVERIARRHHLWGIGSETLRAVRDPIAVARALNDAGIAALEVCLDPSRLPHDGSWLVKPRGSSGGRGIEASDGSIDSAFVCGLLSATREGTELLRPVHGTDGLRTIDRNYEAMDRDSDGPIRLPREYRPVLDLS